MGPKGNILLNSLLTSLVNNRERLSMVEDEHRRNQILRDILEEACIGYNNQVSENLRRIFNYYIDTKRIKLDDLIQIISSRLCNPFDLETKEREELDDFDGIFGTNTSVVLEQFELPEDVSYYRMFECARYHPSPIRSVRKALDLLSGLNVDYSKFVFIDIGSGLGRNLLIAMEYPFKEIIGIEISKFLHDEAVSNLKKYNSANKLCRNIEIKCIDARDFQFPKENMIMYFWEPFGPAISNQFVANLSRFLMKNMSLRILLIFLGQVFPYVKRSSLFKEVGVFKTRDISIDNQYFTLAIYSLCDR